MGAGEQVVVGGSDPWARLRPLAGMPYKSTALAVLAKGVLLPSHTVRHKAYTSVRLVSMDGWRTLMSGSGCSTFITTGRAATHCVYGAPGTRTGAAAAAVAPPPPPCPAPPACRPGMAGGGPVVRAPTTRLYGTEKGTCQVMPQAVTWG